jgi:hypothetical protein
MLNKKILLFTHLTSLLLAADALLQVTDNPWPSHIHHDLSSPSDTILPFPTVKTDHDLNYVCEGCSHAVGALVMDSQLKHLRIDGTKISALVEQLQLANSTDVPIEFNLTLRVQWPDGQDAIAPQNVTVLFDKARGRRLSLESGCNPYIWNWDGVQPILHCMVTYGCYRYDMLTSDTCSNTGYVIT